MTQDIQISFFGCCKAEPGITVRVTGHPRYRYIESAARRLARWITVTVKFFHHTVTRRIRAFVRSAVCTSGVQILHRCAILRI